MNVDEWTRTAIDNLDESHYKDLEWLEKINI